MKALIAPAVALLMFQIGCSTTPGRVNSAAKSPSLDDAIVASAKMGPSLPTPDVAVMPTQQGILIAWKPVQDADGYFVYRESDQSKQLLAIGPREAEGYIDRNPPTTKAKYTVQAFKLSAPSEEKETKALRGSAQQSKSNENGIDHKATGLRVSFPI